MLYIIIGMGLSVTSDTIIFDLEEGELTMARFIDADSLKESLCPYTDSGYSQDIETILAIVNEEPAADVRPERYSHWIQREDGCFECATCGYSYEHEGYVHFFAYCPCCGAKMIRSDEAANK